MRDKVKSSSGNTRCKYLVARNWLDGTLCFWRNNPLYSQASKDYFEASLSRMSRTEKNLSTIQ